MPPVLSAEKVVLAANITGEFETIAIRPRLVWGPGDTSVLPEVLKMIKAGSFRWINGGRAVTSTTYIDNLVHAIALSLNKARPGEAYFITDDEALPFKDFLTRLLATQGVEVSDKSVPAGLLRPLAYLIEKTWRLLGIRKAPPITRFAADIMSVNCTLDISKAKQDLGYHPVISIAQGMQAMPRLDQH